MVSFPNPDTAGSTKRNIRRKTAWISGVFLFCATALLLILNMETTTRQSINYQVWELKIPLYLKLSNFMDRHWNYHWLVKRIVQNRMDENQKTKAIFRWTLEHIADQPSQLDIVDDHVWNIIVRGYGTEDQSTDVFATLCNYAGLKAVIISCDAPKGKVPARIWLSAIYFNNSWRICDISRGIEFKNREGQWATVAEVLAGVGKAEHNTGSPHKGMAVLDYPSYFQALKTIDFDKLYRINRSTIQKPFARFLYFLRDRKI